MDDEKGDFHAAIADISRKPDAQASTNPHDAAYAKTACQCGAPAFDARAGSCLVHAVEKAAKTYGTINKLIEGYVKINGSKGSVPLLLRGTTISQEHLELFFSLLADHARISSIDLSSSTMESTVEIDGDQFEGVIDFREAVANNIVLRGHFSDGVWMDYLTAKSVVVEEFTEFDGVVDLTHGILDSLIMEVVTVSQGMTISNTRISGELKAAWCRGSSFDCSGSRIDGEVNLRILVPTLTLDRIRCSSPTLVAAPWAEISANNCDFRDHALLTMDITFGDRTDAVVRHPSRASSFGMISQLEDPPFEVPTWRKTAAPRLLTLSGSNVHNLRLSGVDMRAARLVGAHGLNEMAPDDTCIWPSTKLVEPRKRIHIPFTDLHWCLPYRIATRDTIADEHDVRADSACGGGWLAEETEGSDVHLVRAHAQVADAYRQLRKRREDSGNEPGAADFYFGEMEMRRRANRSSVLWGYWLVSGYALKASRSFTALILLVLFSAGIFYTWGIDFTPESVFTPEAVGVNPWTGALEFQLLPNATPPMPRQAWEALRTAIYSAVSLLGPIPEASLTVTGQVTHMALRLFGPVLLGLGLLSVRNKVKR